MVDSLNYYIYHIDDEGSWVKYPQLHPNFTSSCKSDEEAQISDFKCQYYSCKYHLELKEYGQDESSLSQWS